MIPPMLMMDDDDDDDDDVEEDEEEEEEEEEKDGGGEIQPRLGAYLLLLLFSRLHAARIIGATSYMRD